MVDQQGEPGHSVPDAPVLLEDKAVGDISAEFRSCRDHSISLVTLARQAGSGKEVSIRARKAHWRSTLSGAAGGVPPTYH